jgi:hypothetical protein
MKRILFLDFIIIVIIKEDLMILALVKYLISNIVCIMLVRVIILLIRVRVIGGRVVKVRVDVAFNILIFIVIIRIIKVIGSGYMFR